MIGIEDQKITVTKFKGLYNRGSVDEVPTDHAQDLLNCSFTTDSRFATRYGSSKALNVANGVRRMFSTTQTPANYNESLTNPPGATDGQGLLIMDNTGDLYVGNSTSPIKSFQGTPDFCAVNVGNRTLISPNDGIAGYQLGRLQVYTPMTGEIRDAAGLAPIQTDGASLSASLSSSSGVVATGTHKFAVIYETESGFLTPPGPKLIETSVTVIASPTPTDPTVIHLLGHGLVTGESHTITGATGPLAIINDTWHITVIDFDNFSIPVNTYGIGTSGTTVTLFGAFTPATVDADGLHAIDIGAIPIGPSFVTKRRILATRANEAEFFFLPDNNVSHSTIQDNTTISTTVDFDDTSLVDSADYLFDLLEVVPGGGSICKYAGRIVIGGPYFPGDSGERVIVSNVNDPETFNYVSGYIQVQTERDGNRVASSYVLRDVLYIGKFTGTFSTQDNGGDPSTWHVEVVDSVIGSYNYGTTEFTITQSGADTGDAVLIASRLGLVLFDGVMRRPELSWKIQKFWLRINFNHFYKVTVAHDPWNHLIYVSVPLDNAVDPNLIIVCDYTDGRDPNSVRWSIFQFPWTTTCIGMLYFGSSIFQPLYTLLIGSIGKQSVYALNPSATDDDGQPICSYYVPGPFVIEAGTVSFFKLINFRAWGRGTMYLDIGGEDGQWHQSPPSLVLSLNPGRDLTRQINLANEKMSVKFSIGGNITNLGDYAKVDRLDVWGISMWMTRPSI